MFPGLITSIDYQIKQIMGNYFQSFPPIRTKDYEAKISGCAQSFNQLIPCIDIRFKGYPISVEDMARFASDLLERLTVSSLKEYTNISVTFDISQKTQRIFIEFVEADLGDEDGKSY